MNYGIIYKATNLLNGKIYIGQTSKSLRERILQHKRDSIRLRNRNITFYNAIKKYGVENFNWCIIDEADSRGSLDVKECFWIDYYNSYIHAKNTNGYNMTLGGDGLHGYKPTKESIEKMLKSREGYRHSEETKRKQSEAHKGKSKSDSHRKNLSESRKGKFLGDDHVRSRAVIKLSVDGKFIERYPSVTDGAKSVNGNTTKISYCCMGLKRHKTHKGFMWMYEDDYNEGSLGERLSSKKVDKEIVQLSTNGSFIRFFNSAKEACICIGFPNVTGEIHKCCRNNNKSARGFKWMYKEDYLASLEVGEKEESV